MSSNQFKEKFFLCFFIFLLIVSGFFIFPKEIKAEELPIDESWEGIYLKRSEEASIFLGLMKELTKEKIDFLSSPEYEDPRRATANELIAQAARRNFINYSFIDFPTTTIKVILKECLNIIEIKGGKEILVVLGDKLDKLILSSAKDYLLQNEIKISVGATKFKPIGAQPSEEFNLQYLITYQPTSPGYGKIKARFYSLNPLILPLPQGASITSPTLYLVPYLSPFIIEIEGKVKKESPHSPNYSWRRITKINYSFQKHVPDFGLKPKSWWRRHITSPFLNKINAAKVILRKLKKALTKSSESNQKEQNETSFWRRSKDFFKKDIPNKAKKGVHKIKTGFSWMKNRIKHLFQKKEKHNPAALVKNLPTPKEPEKKEESVEKEENPASPAHPATSSAHSGSRGLTNQLNLPLSNLENECDKISDKIKILREKIQGLANQKKEKNEKKETEEENVDIEKRAKEETENREEKEEAKRENSRNKEIEFCEKSSGAPKMDRIILHEVAWMGNDNSYNNEWIELKNISVNEINLSGWQLVNKNKKIKIIFGDEDKISAGGYYLLERTDDETVPSIKANKIYKGALSNKNEGLYLFSPGCSLEDKVEANPDWPAGDNDSKRTMERTDNLGWQDSSFPGGTPNQDNSSGYSGQGQNTIDNNLSGAAGAGISSPPTYSAPPPSSYQPEYFSVFINEIMYDLAGADDGREWIEIYNGDSRPVDLSKWKISENSTNHNLNFTSSSVLPPDTYAVITDDKEKFLEDYPNYSGLIFDSTFSLSNEGEKIELKNNNLLIDSLDYCKLWGGSGDGNSLQRISLEEEPNKAENWRGAPPTPGAANIFTPEEETEEETEEEETEDVEEGVLIYPASVNFVVISEDEIPPHPQNLIIYNNTKETFKWRLSTELGWFALASEQGETPPHGISLIKVFVTSPSYSIGSYSNNIVLSTSDDNKKLLEIPVTHTVVEKTFKKVIINEIAWMGTKESAQNEWIELYNTSNEDIDLTGWRLETLDRQLVINFLPGENEEEEKSPIIIPSKGYFLLERTDDNTLPDIDADFIYKGSLANDKEQLRLTGEGGVQDEVRAFYNWFAGDNNTKQTMERITPEKFGSDPANWGSSLEPGGTPKRKNSVYSPPSEEEPLDFEIKNLSAEASGNNINLSWESSISIFEASEEQLIKDIPWTIEFKKEGEESFTEYNNAVNINEEGKFSTEIKNLDYDTTYFLRISFKNRNDVVRSSSVSCLTSLPVVSSLTAGPSTIRNTIDIAWITPGSRQSS